MCYPLLVARVADKTEATSDFFLFDRVRSYPTTIFKDDDDRVHAVHQGYTGPATGEANRELRRRFESPVQELLAAADIDPRTKVRVIKRAFRFYLQFFK